VTAWLPDMENPLVRFRRSLLREHDPVKRPQFTCRVAIAVHFHVDHAENHVKSWVLRRESQSILELVSGLRGVAALEQRRCIRLAP